MRHHPVPRWVLVALWLGGVYLASHALVRFL